MTGTIRTSSSRSRNTRVNHEKEWKRRRIGNRIGNSWDVRPGAFRRVYDYKHTTHSGDSVENKREIRRSGSALKRKAHKLARKDKLYRIERYLQEDMREWQVEEEEKWDKWEDDLKKDSLVYEKLTEEEKQHAQDYALVMKFGSSTVRLPYTYIYSSLYTGQCLVRYIGDKWLVLPCDLVLDDLTFLYSSCAWEHGSIGFLIDVTIPKDPICQDIKGHFLKWLY